MRVGDKQSELLDPSIDVIFPLYDDGKLLQEELRQGDSLSLKCSVCGVFILFSSFCMYFKDHKWMGSLWMSIFVKVKIPSIPEMLIRKRGCFRC